MRAIFARENTRLAAAGLHWYSDYGWILRYIRATRTEYEQAFSTRRLLLTELPPKVLRTATQNATAQKHEDERRAKENKTAAEVQATKTKEAAEAAAAAKAAKEQKPDTPAAPKQETMMDSAAAIELQPITPITVTSTAVPVAPALSPSSSSSGTFLVPVSCIIPEVACALVPAPCEPDAAHAGHLEEVQLAK